MKKSTHCVGIVTVGRDLSTLEKYFGPVSEMAIGLGPLSKAC